MTFQLNWRIRWSFIQFDWQLDVMTLKVTLTPKFFHVNKLSLLPWLIWRKSFRPWIFPSDVVPFQSKEVERFFGPWTTIQENRSSLFCDVISGFDSRAKQAQTERGSFLFLHKIPDSCIVSGCSNSSDSESGRALHRIPFINDCRTEWVRRKKKWIDFAISHCLCFFSWANDNPGMTSQSTHSPLLSSMGQKTFSPRLSGQ